MKTIVEQLDEAFGANKTRMQKFKKLREEIAQEKKDIITAIVDLKNEIHTLNKTLNKLEK